MITCDKCGKQIKEKHFSYATTKGNREFCNDECWEEYLINEKET